MAGDGDGTYLEDFIDSIASVPYQVRRNFELMKQLDADSDKLLSEVAAWEKKYQERSKTQGTVHSKRTKGKASPAAKAPPHLDSMDMDELWQEILTKRDQARQKIDEKVAVAKQTRNLVQGHCQRLEGVTSYFAEELRGTSVQIKQIQYKPDDPVAFCLPSSDEWVLGRIVLYRAEEEIFEVCDEDDRNNVYISSGDQVIVLDPTDLDLSIGGQVFAVYPDTTSFYQATITHLSRRGGNAHATAQVKFVDDADETGKTPERTVALKHMMKPPQ